MSLLPPWTQAKVEGIKNAEHEAEERADREKWEKSLGVLTYLGQSSSEVQGQCTARYFFGSKGVLCHGCLYLTMEIFLKP